MTFTGIEISVSGLEGAILAVEDAQRTVNGFADTAWSELTENDVVSNSLSAVQEAADEAWSVCTPVLSTSTDAVYDGAKGLAYLGGRFALGIADVGEDAYIGAKANAEIILGDEKAAVETAWGHIIDEAADSLGDALAIDGEIRQIGDYAESGGELAAEIALGAVTMSAAAPVAVVTGSVLVLDEMGKSLESGAADGEISGEDIAAELVTGTVTAGTLVAGRGLSNLARSKDASSASAGAKAADAETSSELNAKTGGSYSELRKVSLETEEVNHMPAKAASPLKESEGPAIRMSKDDHRQTASCGNSLEAREYRAAQQELIEQGKFMDAIQMDIDDIREKFGSKYDDAISEMLEYASEKGLI